MGKRRRLFFYKHYFEEFYSLLNRRAQEKVAWTLSILEDLERIPEVYFKHLKNTDGLYEARIQTGRNIFRVFCFFDNNNIIVVGHGFQKKTQKTPAKEIEKAEAIKRAYYEEKQSHQS